MNQRAWIEYRACAEELLFSSQVQHMKSIRHRPGMSCYEHSAFVSYVAWYLADRWGTDARIAARAGLLHDLYLYDPRTLSSYRQCFAHPVAAAENAAALCGGLTARERNCILAHMWPLSRWAPRSREAAAVCLADKLCATAEIMQIWRNLSLRRAASSGAWASLSLTGSLLFSKWGRRGAVLQRKERKKGWEIVQASQERKITRFF